MLIIIIVHWTINYNGTYLDSFDDLLILPDTLKVRKIISMEFMEFERDEVKNLLFYIVMIARPTKYVWSEITSCRFDHLKS